MNGDNGSKIEEGILALVRLAGRVRAQAPQLLAEVRGYAQHPRALSALVEDHSPWLSRHIMGLAANLTEPFTAGMGISVNRFTGELIEVGMPSSWRNRGASGRVHSGALSVLGEATVKMYWDFHLDFKTVTFFERRVVVNILLRSETDLRAVFRFSEVDREALLYRLRVDKRVLLETQTQIFDALDRLVAEVDIEWDLRQRPELSGSTGTGGN